MRLLRELLRPSHMLLKWRNCVYPGFTAVTGAKQGDPLSGISFAISVDSYIRWSSTQLWWHLPVHRQVWFADDHVLAVVEEQELDAIAV
eukprot:2120879-Amphidinium_carterae.1